MPARDRYHVAVRNALIADGWTITHDPLRLAVGIDDVYVDLGAEQLLAAERGPTKIAVEVKTFAGRSDMADFEQALGQYVLYREMLAVNQRERTLYLAVPAATANLFFERPLARLIIRRQHIAYLAFDPVAEVITSWNP